MNGDSLSILAVEPYHGGSHRYFLEGLARHSRHRLQLLTLPARYWKWRLHGGAVTLAERALAAEAPCDLVLASDMLNLPTFLALTRRRFWQTPVVLYFHENQATYPMPPLEKRDLTYAYINWASLAAADRAWVNSRYHLREFFRELPRILKHFPDYQNLESVAAARGKSEVMEPGLDLARFDRHRRPRGRVPRILWNHRWEYDKDPEAFFRVLARVKQAGVRFELALAGHNARRDPREFTRARARFADELVHYGFLDDFAAYAELLWGSHLVVSTARHEFFGMAVVEAMYCRCHPLLPNRLNYPALVPQKYLYGDEDELVEKMVALLREPSLLDGETARRRAARFDWSARAPLYDEGLQRIAAGVTALP